MLKWKSDLLCVDIWSFPVQFVQFDLQSPKSELSVFAVADLQHTLPALTLLILKPAFLHVNVVYEGDQRLVNKTDVHAVRQSKSPFSVGEHQRERKAQEQT